MIFDYIDIKIKKMCIFYKKNGFLRTVIRIKNIFFSKNGSKKKMTMYIRKNFEIKENRENPNPFTKNILFSIIVPLYNTNSLFLREMVESCIAQTYSNWELCLADGSDKTHMYVKEIIEKYAITDNRIKYIKLEKNDGISENSNSAIKMSSGDFICLLDHDDILHPSVLYEYMQKICDNNADLLYCDEATFTKKLDNVVTLHFKPDFALDNLRANNYICHFLAFDKSLLKQAGAFRKEYDGSQDHDLILRLSEKAKNIVHIPRVLYYWRAHAGSVAADINSKLYAIEAGKKAVLESIKRSGMYAIVESSWVFPTLYRIKYDLIDTPLISIIIPNCDHKIDLQKCINSIISKTTYKNYEIIIVENNSKSEDIFEYYERIKSSNVHIIKWKGEFNYSAINNYAVKSTNGKYIVLLNNDTEIISPNWLEEMLMYAQRDDVGAVGGKLYYPDNTIQHAGIILGLGEDRTAGHGHYRCSKDEIGYMGRLWYAQDVSAVTGACIMLKKQIYDLVGGLDEKLFAVAYNDVDLCLKIRNRGYLIVWTPYAELYHYESKSRGYEFTKDKIDRFNKEKNNLREKWGRIIDQGDPYYNVNLTLDNGNFMLK